MESKVNHKHSGSTAIVLLKLLIVLAITPGCGVLGNVVKKEVGSSESGNSEATNSGNPEATNSGNPEAEKNLNSAEEYYTEAKAGGIPDNEDDGYQTSRKWWIAVDDVLMGIEKCKNKDETYAAYCDDFNNLAKEIILAFEQYFYDSMNSRKNPHWIWDKLIEMVNEPTASAFMKDPAELFKTAEKMRKKALAENVQTLGKGSVRDYVRAEGEGTCWFGAAPIAPDAVNYENLQWLYDNVKESMYVGCITNVNPDSYHRSGPDRIRITYQNGHRFEHFREFPVNNDGSSDEYAMDFPLKSLEEEIKKSVNEDWNGKWVRVSVNYIITERVNAFETREVRLARGEFFLAR